MSAGIHPLSPLDGLGGFRKAISVPAGDYNARDGDSLVAIGPKTINLPLAARSTTGVKIRSRSGTLTIASTVGDTITVTSITSGQSVEYAPLAGEWLKM